MSRKSSGAVTKINYPLVGLWVGSVAAAAIGYLFMASSNTVQAEVFTSGTVDYPRLFSAQSGSTLGTTLIGVGVLGIIIALALHARLHSFNGVTPLATAVVEEAELAELNIELSAPAVHKTEDPELDDVPTGVSEKPVREEPTPGLKPTPGLMPTSVL